MKLTDIPDDLIKGNIYLGEQLLGFLCEYSYQHNVIITLQPACFKDPDATQYKVIEIQKGFLHTAKRDVYQVPDREGTTIYIVDNVK